MMSGSIGSVAIVGAGLAGCEAAWQLASRGLDVDLYEMRPDQQTPAHRGADLAELVCSNSFKSLSLPSAAATLKAELAALNSFVLKVALANQVPAGQALAVDRTGFSQQVTMALEKNPHIRLLRQQVDSLEQLIVKPGQQLIVATGPLTASALADTIAAAVGHDHLAFYDAAAPVVEADTLDHELLFSQSRYDKSGPDYLNAAMDKDQYDLLISELCQAKQALRRDFERSELFQACQPIEEVARTGPEALRHGALKPFGLRDPRGGPSPYAVVQLRAENAARSAYNLVGFQTNLTFAEQRRVFGLIPGLKHASFSRYGVMHRNTYIDSPHVLGPTLELPQNPTVRFAGQITGTEGYTEAIASGLYAALNCYANYRGQAAVQLPPQSCFGALLAYATNPDTMDYQPMHVNYGIMPPLPTPPKQKHLRYAAYSERALRGVADFIATRPDLDFAAGYQLPNIAVNTYGATAATKVSEDQG